MAEITIRLFNTLSKYASGSTQWPVTLADGSTVGDALERLGLPEEEIFLLLHNGRNIMQGFGFNSGIDKDRILHDGDVLAFSGPIPFSRGYGAAIV